MKDQLRSLFLETLEALSLDRVLHEKIRCEDGVLEVDGLRARLEDYRKVLVVAVGKGAYPMAKAFADIVQPYPASGVVVSPTAPENELPYFLHYVGGHPQPNAESFHAAGVTLELLEDLKPHHLVVYLLSGGGSAILERPIDDAITLEDSKAFFQTLVTSGADIVEINTLRKHLSAVKGGRLAVQAYPARQWTLYVSDVPPDEPSSVASGPTMPDETTVEDCYRILENRRLLDKLPASVRRLFEEKRIEETPKSGDRRFESSSYSCLLDNSDALAEVERRTDALGWEVESLLFQHDLPVRELADELLGRLIELKAEFPDKTVAILNGGELSSPVTGDGRGGRNQAFVLDCVRKIAGKKVAVISAGTDGVDGNSPAAGAVADGSTLARAEALGMDPDAYFQRSDSYGFFDRLGDALVTGPSGNNVRDVRLLVAW